MIKVKWIVILQKWWQQLKINKDYSKLGRKDIIFLVIATKEIKHLHCKWKVRYIQQIKTFHLDYSNSMRKINLGVLGYSYWLYPSMLIDLAYSKS